MEKPHRLSFILTFNRLTTFNVANYWLITCLGQIMEDLFSLCCSGNKKKKIQHI